LDDVGTAILKCTTDVQQGGQMAPKPLHRECDVLLITVTETETRAVLEAANLLTGTEPIESFGNEKTYLSLGSIGGARVLLVRSEMGSDSVGGAVITTRDALSETNPASVIMVGISFGVDTRRQKIGQILVSKQIQGYELQRVGTNTLTGAATVTIRGDRASASPRLLDRFRTAAIKWKEAPVEFGLIISGQKLVDNRDYRENLKELLPEAIGGEMEGAGVYAAAYNHNWIIVKAIADWADGNKKRNKAARQKKAASAAARFVLYVVNTGGFSSRASDPVLSTPSPTTLEPKPALLAGNKPAIRSRVLPLLGINDSTDSDFVDLWTPGLSKKYFLANYGQLVGPDYAETLWSYSRKAIKAVEDGNFGMKLRLGRMLRSEAHEWAPLEAMGHYLSAEGNRLLADLSTDSTKQSQLLVEAAEDYQTATILFPADPRPKRGLGRLYEVQGDIGKALSLLEEAKALSLLRLSQIDRADLPLKPHVAHEALRATRHLIHCLLEVRRTNKLSEWNREHKTRQLVGYIVECENLHRELMPLFRSQERWWLIEWFMGLVFLARAWGAVGDRARMTSTLLHALHTKRRSMPHTSLSPVDRINLQWWLDVAFSAPNGPDPLLLHKIESIRRALSTFQDEEVLSQVSDLLLLHLPPWEVPAA
jgi:nucleoside phosphorylase